MVLTEQDLQRAMQNQNYQPDHLENELNSLAHQIHLTAREKGWYEQERNQFEMLALVHSEISEVVEAMRKGNPPSEKCPQITQVEEEIADVFIRLLDMAKLNNWRLATAIRAKMKYNESRPYRHGNKLA